MRHWIRFLVYSMTLFTGGALLLSEPPHSRVVSARPDPSGSQSSNDDALRRLWSDPMTFEMLSGAAQTLLESKFGKRVQGGVKPVVQAPGSPDKRESKPGSEAGPRDSVLSALTNSAVNDPAADATAQKTQSETTIVLGSSSVVAGFNDSGSFLGGAQKFTGYSRSTDGVSWTDKGTLPTNANGDAGDPVLARNTTTGRIYFTTLNFTGAGLRLFRSDDDGNTFGAPVDPGPGVGASDELDKEWIAVDNFAGVGNGNVYEITRNFVGGSNSGGIFLFRSTDNGDTWGPTGGTLIASAGSFNVQGAFVAVGLDHSVHAFWLDQSAGSGTPNILKVRRSTDQGVTFGPPVTIATLNTTGVNGGLGNVGGFRTNSFCHAAVNPINGNVYVVYNDINAPAPTDLGDVYFRQSSDSGATWSAATKVNMDTTTHLNWSPTLAVTPDGTKVFVTWYDRRRDPGDALIERWGRIGSVSGVTVTFGFDFCISNASFPAVFGQDPVVNSTYMGDYDAAAADNSFFYATWGDNRLPVSAPDVRSAKIPVAGPGPIIGFLSAAVTGGNGDGVVQPDECNNLAVTISNCGTAAASGITATLTASTAGVTILDATQPYADIGPGASGTNATPFKISTSPSFVCGTTINLTLTVNYTGGPDVIQFSIPSGGQDYLFSTSGGNTIVPGITDIGNHGDDVITNIVLPFSYTFYGTSFNSANVSSNGNLQFVSNNAGFDNSCLPAATMNMLISPHWDDLRTDIVAGTGIFTSTSGVAPNRIFNIEWRASYFSGAGGANFEIRLFEGQNRADLIYGAVDQTGSSATVGVQKDTGSRFTQFECNVGGITNGLGVSFTLPPCTAGNGQCQTCTSPDIQPPAITCPAPISRNTKGNKCVTVTYAPSVSDNCPGTTVVCVPASGFCFPVGATSVTCTATDASNNTSNCTFTVTVVKQKGQG